MKLIQITIFSFGLLAFTSCNDTTRNDKKIDIDNTRNMQSDTLQNERESDYQNQSGSRTNSDTINQSGQRPDELK